MATSKRYKLFSAQGEEKPPCAFFMSEKGCRNGANCKFAHVEANAVSKEADKTVEARAIIETGSVVSSESDDDGEFAEPRETQESGKKRKKSRRGKTNESPFAKPKKVKTTPPTATITDAPNPTPQETPSTEASKVKQRKPAESTLPSFRDLNLPVASFSLGSATNNAREPVAPIAAPEPPTPTPLQAPLPKHTNVGLKWLKAVEKTREHPKYESEFKYEKYFAADEPMGGEKIWVKTKRFGKWCKNHPQAIAIDCEMCETKDPVTGKVDTRALCRISVVDAETDEVLLDSLVKPDWPVIDYRSRINGIKEENLKNVQFTLRHAQAFMTALCSDETVVLGQSVINDLVAIRMEHYCVVDSAYLFKAADSETATVGLKDLSLHILKKPMPATHDSVNDARAALRCLEYYLEKDGDVEPITRTPRQPKSNLAEQLFIHRIPKTVKKEHLAEVFLDHTCIAPDNVDEVIFTGDTGKTHVHFKTSKHANLAFTTLEGTADPDASGRLQKRLYLRGGGYIRVRKMVNERERNSDAKKSGAKTP